jgi:hypothetical protein
MDGHPAAQRKILQGSLVKGLFGYFGKSFFGNCLRFFNGAGLKGLGGKKFWKLQVCSQGRAEGAAGMGAPIQLPFFFRAVCQDGLYDDHQAQV